MIRKAILRASPKAGQSIYQTMLIISCVALALAVFFPVYEYVDLYRVPGARPSRRAPIERDETIEETAEPAEGASEAPAPAEGEEEAAEEPAAAKTGEETEAEGG